MFFPKIPESQNSENFLKINVDEKTFYYLRPTEKQRTPKRRYGDQFKDPCFIAKDTHRKLNMIRQFKRKYKDMSDATAVYINCIEECILILKKEFLMDPRAIFRSFNLKQFGINSEDFGIEEAECISEEE